MPTGIYKHHPQQGFQKGHKCFSYNLKFLSEKSKKKRQLYYASIKSKHISPQTEFKKGHIPSHKGKNLLAMTGEKHPNWQGGKCNHLYPTGWTKILKKRVKIRDNFKCQFCGTPQEECIKTLHIHHIDYDKKNLNLQNLITLCEYCHKKTTFNRQYWKSYFLSLLEDKYEIPNSSIK